ncbi:MAG: Gfo/Idh/MocA family protein [Bacteroidales bacterium]
MEMESDNKENSRSGKVHRREWVKTLATVPVLGVFAYAWYRKHRYDRLLKKNIFSELKMSTNPVPAPPPLSQGKTLRLGIIGYGIRGPHLARAAGFAHPAWIDAVRDAAALHPSDTRYQDFLAQDDLNVVVNGVCDIFDTYGELAVEAGANIYREGTGGKMGDAPRRYNNYKELCASPDIDAVIIATPDHWHGPMTIEAARNGKHVYCEKPMTWTVQETYEVVKAVKENGVVFQLGHQGRQTESYIKAREAIAKDLLGKITLIEVTTNRNDPNGAWVYPIHPDAGPDTIDWEQFIGPAPWHEFSLERFFRWRCWWDYSTGLSGDLLTHEYDAMNQILGLGIPRSAVSSGGIYFYKDGRTVPDVLHTVFEYPDKDLTLMYSATLASQRSRGKVIMGHDASMELGDTLIIKADPASTRYAGQIRKGMIDPSIPIYTYTPGTKQVDAVTSATEQYFAGRGLLYTYRGGKRVDTTHLHIREWIDAIRTGSQTSCHIDAGFEEAMTAHMGTIAYREGRKVYWDPDKQKII